MTYTIVSIPVQQMIDPARLIIGMMQCYDCGALIKDGGQMEHDNWHRNIQQRMLDLETRSTTLMSQMQQLRAEYPA